MSIAPTTTLAQKEFFVQDQALLAGGIGQEILLEANSDIPFLGFSFGAIYDVNILTVTDVTTEGATISDPSFFKGMVDGGMIGYGCVFDFQLPFRTIPPGEDIVLCKIVVDVAPDIDAETTVTLTTVTVSIVPTSNIITNEHGGSEVPSLINGILTIQTRRPGIDSIDGNEGFAGDTFTVTGTFFDQPGLLVTVCGVEAPATLEGDTLTVTAPACEPIGFAELVVTTDRGSVSDPNGFNYLEIPIEPVDITAVDPSSGPAGTEITITGLNFEGEALVVTICGNVDAGATLEADGTISATVPDCGAEGEVEVDVCQGVDNCDSEMFNFTVPPVGTPFRRGDPKDDGSVNISSAIFILNFLFGGNGLVAACADASDANGSKITSGSVGLIS